MKHDQSYVEKDFTVIGTRVPRPDGVDKVTGRAKYGADAYAPGQLVGLVLRSPHAHARIKSINTSKAEKVPGVKAILTAEDLPDLTGGRELDTLENCMARDRVLYDGHAVAAVAAIDKAAAKQALKLIKVSYEKLPHVTDVDEALKPDAPVVQPRHSKEGQPANQTARMEFGHGDVDEGLKEADVVVEKSFKTGQTHQGYIEPHACLASVSPDGSGELWVTTQGHFTYRNVCASLLGMDIAKLKVTSSEIGGGFGGKTHVWIEPLALALSRKANRPVKMVMSREEVFKASGPTCSSSMDVRIGARKDGTITSARIECRYNAGAFPGMWGMLGGMTAWACYDLPNCKSIGIDVVTNRPKVAAYRAPSAPMMAFGVESTLDILAAKLGMDSVQLRLKNVAREGTRASYGPTYGPIGIEPTLEAVRDHPHMKAKLKKNQGRGMACGFWFNIGGQTCVDLNIGVDGTVSLSQGTVDVGGARASMGLIAAEELGIPYDQVKTNVADTASLGHTDTTEGSRGTFSSGMATIFAAREAIEVLKQRASKMMDVPVEDIVWENGEARAAGDEHSNLPPLSLKEIAAKSPQTGGPIAGHNEVTADGAGVSFASHIVDVEVDPETGATKILRYTVVQDAGKAIHPDYVEGQMQGAAAQGIGWALNEEYIYGADGLLQNPGFLDYRIPVCSDLPMLDAHILEIPNPNHPYGIRGVGETSIVPPLAAIGNAVSNAVGVRMDATPMSPPRILAAMDAETA
ncbi:MAG TPA: oxidoreductase [Gammaproteobacteria bacterium]|nr:oxidoreductase [Gammaproteobacteria bacterium]